MKVKCYRQLLVWQKAMDLVGAVHAVTLSFPRAEMFGLTSQVNRAAVSVPSSIAEGQGRRTTGNFVHFIGTARGSLNEIETPLNLAFRYNYLSSADHAHLLKFSAEIGRMLSGLIDALECRSSC